MTNIFVAQMKDVVINYHKKARQLKQEMQSNSERFQSAVADEENKKIQEKSLQYYNEAKLTINSIFEQVRTLLAIANFPNVESLAADRLFFEENTPLDLTADEVVAFIEKYKDNPTMLRIIKYWIEKNHAGMTEYLTVEKSIHLLADQLAIYKKFAISALSLVDNIYQNPSIDELMITAFADENSCAELYLIIGNGMMLADFKSTKVPESAKHCFDDISLNLNPASHFQGAVPPMFEKYKIVC